MKFIIEQLALNPINGFKAKQLMDVLGWTDWVTDHATAVGQVYGEHGRENVAALSFNYQARPHDGKPLELELINYLKGENWLAAHNSMTGVASHIGMHVSGEELEAWRAEFFKIDVFEAQEVVTTNHTNPNVPKDRSYRYVIFDTRDIIGIDIKFIVRETK